MGTRERSRLGRSVGTNPPSVHRRARVFRRECLHCRRPTVSVFTPPASTRPVTRETPSVALPTHRGSPCVGESHFEVLGYHPPQDPTAIKPNPTPPQGRTRDHQIIRDFQTCKDRRAALAWVAGRSREPACALVGHSRALCPPPRTTYDLRRYEDSFSGHSTHPLTRFLRGPPWWRQAGPHARWISWHWLPCCRSSPRHGSNEGAVYAASVACGGNST